MTADQVRRQRGKSIVVAHRPAICDRHVKRWRNAAITWVHCASDVVGGQKPDRRDWFLRASSEWRNQDSRTFKDQRFPKAAALTSQVASNVNALPSRSLRNIWRGWFRVNAGTWL